ncbi:hypothetical protein WK76_24845 [Burkholderia ubonensis]|uniref:hypothetical protein n=1 Tax=Burkholderia ubonensis TaxID=101571 RepID=UPI00075ECCAD|nr:hypothetical protein [Burkholderia ubonensis]KVU84261.1 hypothetical protein WK76_24845 [Burkholderia ubonensis]
MLTGPELGKAIGLAVDLKIERGYARSKSEIARHFEMSPPSLYTWIERGAISKDKLGKLFEYFSDVVGPDHWKLTPAERHFMGGANSPDLPAPILEQAARLAALPDELQKQVLTTLKLAIDGAEASLDR